MEKHISTMQNPITVVKGSLYQWDSSCAQAQSWDIEAGEWAAESFRIYHWLKAQNVSSVCFQDPELAYYTLIAQLFGFIAIPDIQIQNGSGPKEIQKREDLERKFMLQRVFELQKEIVRCARLPQNPSISVCVAHRNRPLALQSLLQDLKGQNFRNFEVVVVDDGSSQACQSDLRDLLQKPWGFEVTPVFQNHMGARRARNAAVQAAAGNLLVFVDDDNSALPNMLETFAKAAQNPEYDLWVCPYERQFLPQAHSAVAYESPRKRIWLPLGGSPLGCLQNTLGDMNGAIRRQAFHELKGLDESTGLSCEDWQFLIKAQLAGLKISVLPEVLQIYRDHPHSFFKTAPRLLSELDAIRPFWQQSDLKSNLPIEKARARLLNEYETCEELIKSDWQWKLGIQSDSGSWKSETLSSTQSGSWRLSVLVASNQESMIKIEVRSSGHSLQKQWAIGKGKSHLQWDFEAQPMSLEIQWGPGLFVFRHVALRNRGLKPCLN